MWSCQLSASRVSDAILSESGSDGHSQSGRGGRKAVGARYVPWQNGKQNLVQGRVQREQGLERRCQG